MSIRLPCCCTEGPNASSTRKQIAFIDLLLLALIILCIAKIVTN